MQERMLVALRGRMNDLFELMVLGVAILVIFAMFVAPLEALGWYAGWSPRTLRRTLQQHDVPEPPPLSNAQGYLVYLTGVAGFSFDMRGRRERTFLEELHRKLPDVEIVDDVFPYSVNNNPLNGERALSRFWSWIQRLRLERSHLALISGNLINIRNGLQVAVSADPRYAPIYNLGVAQEIARGLVRHGYTPGCSAPVILLALSGGAQIAVGSAPYLQELLGSSVVVVSLAGVISDDPGILAVRRLYQLQGRRDWIPSVGAVLFPGRWPMFRDSAWNRARRMGIISRIDMGPMLHFGKHDYYSRSTKLPDGTPYYEHTVATAIDIITREVHAES